MPRTVDAGTGEAPALEVRGLSVTYPDGSGAAPAVEGLDLDVLRGEVLCVLGPSGSGKTTLLRAVAGLEPATAGTIRLDGVDLAGVPPHRRDMGLMFQDHALFPHRDVLGNVVFGLRMHGVARADADARARACLELVGLAGFERRGVRELSGGEQQRVALARALAPSPRLLMLDEPLGSLDRELRERLAAELRDLFHRLASPDRGGARDGGGGQPSTVFVTHDQDEAFAIGDRVAVMHAGRIEQVGPPEEVWHRPATATVASFLGWNVLELDGATVAARPEGIRLGSATGTLTGVVVGSTFRRGRHRVRVRLAPEHGGSPADAEHADAGLVDVEVAEGPPAPGSAVGLELEPGSVVRLTR